MKKIWMDEDPESISLELLSTFKDKRGLPLSYPEHSLKIQFKDNVSVVISDFLAKKISQLYLDLIEDYEHPLTSKLARERLKIDNIKKNYGNNNEQ